MIYVSQGHEKGIGLEVFFKSIQLLPSFHFSDITLVAYKKSVLSTLKKCGIDFEIADNGIYFQSGFIHAEWLLKSDLPESSVSFLESIELSQLNSGILFTLPTTKDQLIDPKNKRKKHLGHTELLRSFFALPELGMYFHSDHLRTLLLTDHVSLKNLLGTHNAKSTSNKLNFCLPHLKRLEPSTKRVLISGLNPHCGEGGLLGKEDISIEKALHKIKIKGLKIEGPFSADSLTFQSTSDTDLLVYHYHDQGLGPFKSLSGTLGANITLGLPFIRLSVDHGTAFSLYGKNLADYRGSLYCLNKAIEYQERFCGQNSNN